MNFNKIDVSQEKLTRKKRKYSRRGYLSTTPPLTPKEVLVSGNVGWWRKAGWNVKSQETAFQPVFVNDRAYAMLSFNPKNSSGFVKMVNVS